MIRKIKFFLHSIYVIFSLPRISGRNYKTVKLDYNDTSWKIIANKIRQTLAADPEIEIMSLLSSSFIEPNTNLAVMSKIRITNPTNYLLYKASKLEELFPDKKLNVLELGTGFGWNLSVLRSSGHTGVLTGVDISEVAISLARDISSRYQLNISYSVIDITKTTQIINQFIPDDFDVIFSYQVFEQLPLDTTQLIESLVELFPCKQFIFIESSAKLPPKNLSDLLSKIYVWKKNYQVTLFKTLKNLEASNKIKDFGVERLRCSHKIGNESAVYKFRSV